jgi:hypothetical protein
MPARRAYPSVSKQSKVFYHQIRPFGPGLEAFDYSILARARK